jgi:DNA-binding transcriptional LysR family regulator
METRLLEYFVAVAGELSVTEAARRLYAAQSTVSAGLRSLETDLGVQLLHRTTKTVQLTAAGEELLTEARGILDAVERLHVLASETASGQRGRLTLGTFTGQDLVHDLPSALRAFRLSRPHVDLRLVSSERGSTGYAEDLIRGRLDVAFFALTPPPELDVFELLEIPYVALVAESHELATDPTVSLESLASEPWIDSPPGYGSRVGVEQALAERRLRRQVVTERSPTCSRSPDMSPPGWASPSSPTSSTPSAARSSHSPNRSRRGPSASLPDQRPPIAPRSRP